ncbi:hypothetical protein DV736_g4280, partial [Chaetothyriales sp. CBS 134916]
MPAPPHAMNPATQLSNPLDFARQIIDTVKLIQTSDSKDAVPIVRPQAKLPTQVSEPIARASKLQVKEYKVVESPPTSELTALDAYIFVVRTRIDKTGLKSIAYVDIKTEGLRDILRIMRKDIKWLSLGEDNPTIEQNVLFHNLPELEAYRADQARSRATSGESVSALDLITYDLLWALFKANSHVISVCAGSGKPRCLRYDMDEGEKTDQDVEYFELQCQYLDFDGKVFGTIHNLNTFPLNFHPTHGKIRQSLATCGQKFIELIGTHHRSFTGHAFFQHKDGLLRKKIDSRIMVDAQQFRKSIPSYPRFFIKKSDFAVDLASLFMPSTESSLPRVKSNGSIPGEMKEDDLLICSPTVMGFGLADKILGEYAVENIRSIDWSDLPFNALTIPSPKKEVILAITKNRLGQPTQNSQVRRRTPMFDDVVQGKRPGIITLLQSIDIHVGGQYFRISRDGSKITEDLPPPYTGSPPPSSLRLSSPDPLLSRSSSVSMFQGGRSRSSSVWDAHEDNDGEAGENLTAVHESPAMMQANILDPAEVDMPSPVDASFTTGGGLNSDVSSSEEKPEQNPSYRACPDRVFVPAAARRQRQGSEDTTPPRLEPHASNPASPLRRRNRVRLPSLVTDSLDGRMTCLSSRGGRIQARRASTSPLAVRSAGPVLMNTSDIAIPDSPTFIGRDASALFPRIPMSTQEAGTSSESHGVDLEPGDDETCPPAMESENDISLHYAHLMRRLDREHRKALHEKDKELEQLRVRLNEVDTVYRQELRARDFMIDDLKKRLDHLQETQEQRMEKARHEIEDLWESRSPPRDLVVIMPGESARKKPLRRKRKGNQNLIPWLYDLVVWVLSLLIDLFFREVHPRGAWKIPRKGPIIFVAAPHANQFVDSLILMRIFKREANRRISWLIAETSTKRKFIGALSAAVGAIPVGRALDKVKPAKGKIFLADEANDPTLIHGVGTDFTNRDFQVGGLIVLPKRGNQAPSTEIKEIISSTELRLKKPFKTPEAIQLLTATGSGEDAEGPGGQQGSKGCSFKVAPHVDQSRVYDAVFEDLDAGGCVGIFPEGGSHDRPDLLPIKPGVAIMALGALANNPDCGLKVIPIGMNYFHAHKFRSRAVIEFGLPIEVHPDQVAAYKAGDRRNAVGSLLETVQQGLLAVTQSAPDYETLMLAQTTRRLYNPLGKKLPLSLVVELNRRLVLGYTTHAADPRVVEVKKEVLDYNRRLRALGVRDHQVVWGNNAKRPWYKVLGTLIYRLAELALLSLGVLPGLLMFWPVFVTTKVISRRKSKEALAASTVKLQGRDVISTWKILVALAFAPALYLYYTLIISLWLAYNRSEGYYTYQVPSWLRARTYVPDWVPIWLFAPAFFVLCISLTFAALRIGEVGMDVLKSLPPLFIALNPRSSASFSRLQQRRQALSVKVTEVINQLGPEVFADFDATRIVADPFREGAYQSNYRKMPEIPKDGEPEEPPTPTSDGFGRLDGLDQLSKRIRGAMRERGKKRESEGAETGTESSWDMASDGQMTPKTDDGEEPKKER